jgi:arginine decarboxylase
VHRRRVDAITQNLPALPDFSAFAPAFHDHPDSPAGDVRRAFYAGYEKAVARNHAPGHEAADVRPRHGHRG